MQHEEMVALLEKKGISLESKRDSFWMRVKCFFCPSFKNTWTLKGNTLFYPVKIDRPLKCDNHKYILEALSEKK